MEHLSWGQHRQRAFDELAVAVVRKIRQQYLRRLLRACQHRCEALVQAQRHAPHRTWHAPQLRKYTLEGCDGAAIFEA